jgi:hypothetical protein
MLVAWPSSVQVLVRRSARRPVGVPRISAIGPGLLPVGGRIPCHLMRPGHTRGSGRQAGPAREPGRLRLGPGPERALTWVGGATSMKLQVRLVVRTLSVLVRGVSRFA